MKGFIEIYDDKKQIRREYFPVYLMFILLIGLIIYQAIKKSNYKELYLSTQFNGIVTDIYEEKGDVYLKISNQIEKLKINDSKNYSYKHIHLYKFLKNNDSIFKNECSDTLFIKRKGVIYHFIIEDESYNNNKKSKKYKDYWNSKRQIINERNDCK